ncbi:MAG: response regulator, partial [Planctomycetes bacterium]|nr:response regulator [Planctomycetota bacterium]
MSVSKPQRVLVVDDDPVVRLLLQKHLTADGYETICASSGAEAIPLLLSTTPSVVIADWLMPEMDGLELCRAIRNHDGIPTVFVIIVSAHQTSEDRIVEAFDAGADDFLTKPFKKKELLARVRAGARIIELQRALQRRTRDVHRTNAEMAIVNEKLNTANERLKLWA